MSGPNIGEHIVSLPESTIGLTRIPPDDLDAAALEETGDWYQLARSSGRDKFEVIAGNVSHNNDEFPVRTVFRLIGNVQEADSVPRTISATDPMNSSYHTHLIYRSDEPLELEDELLALASLAYSAFELRRRRLTRGG